DSGEYEDDTGQYKPLIELHERQKKELAREYNSYRSEIAALGYANGDKQKNIVNNGTIENPEATEPQIILPSNNNLEELTKGKTPVLRTWKNGKYICPNLPAFITAYIKTVDDLTHAMIRDYLICEKTKKPFTNKTINQQMKIYGPGRRSKTVIPR
ncbi:MAG: hypothetical protein LBQ88_18740, partial [Treponema sp.]|nr:hypothetical protein [Treponema sp.]